VNYILPKNGRYLICQNINIQDSTGPRFNVECGPSRISAHDARSLHTVHIHRRGKSDRPWLDHTVLDGVLCTATNDKGQGLEVTVWSH